MQGTDQQRYAAAALQKLEWYYTPQTRRWYKAVKSPVIDSARKVSLIRSCGPALLAFPRPDALRRVCSNVFSLRSMPARLFSLSVTWQRQLDALLLRSLCSTSWPVCPSPRQVHSPQEVQPAAPPLFTGNLTQYSLV